MTASKYPSSYDYESLLASGRGEALAFVDRRIEDVMRFEIWKATTKARPSEWVAGLARSLGRARYGD